MNSERYNRHTILKDFGHEAQQKLSNAKVLVVGAGGLGIPVLTYLNAMGVGMLGVVDNDSVSLSNLHRQVLYDEADVGRSKITVVLERLKAQNSETHLVSHDTFLVKENALKIITDYDLVVDASDNFPTRYLVNDACIILNKPFVYGALHGYEGQVSVFNYQGGPTYRCLFPAMPAADEVPNCNEHGVLGIIPGIIGNLQALEAIKVITGVGEVLSGKLLLFNGLNQTSQKINFKLRSENLQITELQDSYQWNDPCETVPSISVKQLQTLLDDEGEIQLIDVRTTTEFENFHLAESINIPLDDIEANLDGMNLKRPVYLLCQSGQRSEVAVKRLQLLHSKTSFYSIFGGVNQFLAICS